MVSKRFLKQLRDDASAVSLSRLFHCGILRGKKEAQYEGESIEYNRFDTTMNNRNAIRFNE